MEFLIDNLRHLFSDLFKLLLYFVVDLLFFIYMFLKLLINNLLFGSNKKRMKLSKLFFKYFLSIINFKKR